MQTLQKYTPFFVSALLMGVVLYFIYPHYQYYIDPDGTAYLTISKRYATGDIHRAINGYWSPWSCWLTALLIKNGQQPIPASVIINALGAAGFLYISQSLFLKFHITGKLQWILNITMALFLCYAVFWQSFDDLWECFFLLCALRIMLSEYFTEVPLLWVATGLLGTLAYFAKAYSFPFFILNTFCCTWFIDKKTWLRISATAIAVMILASLPWIIILHHKYGIWTTSTAGTLNTSWYLVGHPYWKHGIDLLIPPAYPDSPYYWEDPWFANGDTPHFWNSWHLLGLQLLRIGYNILKLFRSMIQISALFPVIVFIAVIFMRSRNRIFSGNVKVLIVSFFLFPLGYLLINFEARYIWYMLPLSMVLGAILIQNSGYKQWGRLLHIVFPVTFLIYPVWGMVNLYDKGKSEYELAEQIKAAHIRGTFTANVHPRNMARLAYFSGDQYYYATDYDKSDTGMINAAGKNAVNFYFRFYNRYEGDYDPMNDHFNLKNEVGELLPELTNDKIAGINIYRIHQ